MYDFATRKWARVHEDARPDMFCRISPDGKSFLVEEGIVGVRSVSIVRPDGRTKISDLYGRAFWSPDGREVVLSEMAEKQIPVKSWRMNHDGTKRVRIPLPEDEVLHDWSADGLWFLLARLDLKMRKAAYLIRRADGTDPRILLDASTDVISARFSPDSKQVAYTRRIGKLRESPVQVIDLATRKDRVILNGDAEGSFSPDALLVARWQVSRRHDVQQRAKECHKLDRCD